MNKISSTNEPWNSLENVSSPQLEFNFQFFPPTRIGFPEQTFVLKSFPHSLIASFPFRLLELYPHFTFQLLNENQCCFMVEIQQRKKRKHWNISNIIQLFAPFFHSLHAHLSTSLHHRYEGEVYTETFAGVCANDIIENIRNIVFDRQQCDFVIPRNWIYVTPVLCDL